MTPTKPCARTLCLHYLHDPSRERAVRRMALTEAALESMVRRERAEGRSPARSEELLAAVAAGPERFVLTFDDAHRSLRDVAAPLLRRLDVAATVFVATGYIGTSSEFLSWDDLRALRDDGWTIGAHSVTHPRMSWRLYDEDDAAYRARLRRECEQSREALARELGEAPALFAYPYGEAPDAAREAVAAAGYAGAFTVNDSLAWSGDRLRIPRLDGHEAHGLVRVTSDEPARFSVVIPAFDRVELLAEVLRGWRAQSYPEDRHEVLVVDDGSTEDLAALFRDAPRHHRLVAQRAGDSALFRAGQARARGAREARFEHLAFLDADVRVGEHFLWHLDWVHRRVERAVVLGYLSGYNLHDLGHVHTAATFAKLGARDADGAVNVIPDRSREPTLRACLDNLDWLEEPWRLCYTGNLSLSRALFDEIDGFDEGFTGWGLEDIDLGYRLDRAGARWVFSRFAVGYHMVDEAEQRATPRNPFRRLAPERAHFDRYLHNLAVLRARHPAHAAIERYAEQTLRDIDETVGRPHTVGIEFGGACSHRCAQHRRTEKCQPGGAPLHELLDRVAYAAKVGARQVYLLGGEPAEHEGFLTVVAEAKRLRVHRVIAETNATPFAKGNAAREARSRGLDHAAVKVFAFDEATYEGITGRRESYARHLRGLEALGEAGVYRTARVVLPNEGALARLDETLERLQRENLRVDSVTVLDPTREASVREAVERAFRGRESGAPPRVSVAPA